MNHNVMANVETAMAAKGKTVSVSKHSIRYLLSQYAEKCKEVNALRRELDKYKSLARTW